MNHPGALGRHCSKQNEENWESSADSSFYYMYHRR